MSEVRTETDRTEATRPPSRDRPRTRSLAGWVVAIVALAVAVVAVIQWFRLDDAEATRAAAARTAGTVLAALTNWQGEDLSGVRAEVAERSTDRFRDEAEALFDEVAQGLAQAGAESEGEILDLVAEVQPAPSEGDRSPTAVALAVVRQQISNIEVEQPDVACWGARAQLRQVEGRWLVDGLELYGPNTCPTDLG